jgi:hypothetical protein
VILHVAIATATLIACEIALRLPIADILGTLTRTPRRIAAVIRSPSISDIRKEKVLPAYAGRMAKASVKLLLCVLAIAAPVVVAATLVTGSLADGAATLMTSASLVVMIVIGAAYVIVRRRISHG